MSRPPILYVAVAAPLVERASEWTVPVPGATAAGREKALKSLPSVDDFGGYRFEQEEEAPEELHFRTGRHVARKLVEEAIRDWHKKPYVPIGYTDLGQPLPPVDHRQGISELRQALQELPVAIEVRIGLTLQVLQDDLANLRPELLVLYCHGSKEGCLVFEDGRGAAEYASGTRVFKLFTPRPCALLLNACYSGAVVRRAKDLADWRDAAIVSIDPATPLEVGAGSKFQGMFFRELLRGQMVQDAFEAARQYVANDRQFGDFSVGGGETAPSRKFRLHPGGESVTLALSVRPAGATKILQETPHVRRIRRSTDRFIGRCQEMASCLDELLPLQAGVRRGPATGQRRLVTLTKEGGIGKTAMAGELADWCQERGIFGDRVHELDCETYSRAEEFLSGLLKVSGVAPAEQSGDLVELLRTCFHQRFPREEPALFILDNLDDLFAPTSTARWKAEKAIEAALDSAPSLRILCTCRWPLGIGDHERPIEVPPLRADEARDVFIENLEPAQQDEVRDTWHRPDSAARELIDKLSGHHPLSLVLLARQMRWPRMTLRTLRDEARADLLKVLVADPKAKDDERDRMKKVEVSYGLSYRHLSEPARRLFERLSRLPGGVWCAQQQESLRLPWDALLGQGWRVLIDEELDYFALMRWQAEPEDPKDKESGRYVMLPSMLQFARKKYRETDHRDWESQWVAWWLHRIQGWKDLVSGHIPEDDRMPRTPEDRVRLGRAARVGGEHLFEKTQANWLAAFEHAGDMKGVDLGSWLGAMNEYLKLSGQHLVRCQASRRVLEVQDPRGAEYADGLRVLGDALKSLGEPEQGREKLEQALRIYRDLATTNPVHQADVAMTLSDLGDVLRRLGEWSLARHRCQEALTVYDSLDVPQHRANAAAARVNLGAVLTELGHWESARKVSQQALETLQFLAADQRAEHEADIAIAQSNLGVSLRKLGDPEGGHTALVEAIRIRRRLADAHWVAYAPYLATSYNNLGNLLGEDLHDWEGACQAYEKALEIRRPLALRYPDVYQPNVAISLSNLAGALARRGMVEDARTRLAEAVDIYRPWAKKRPEAYEPKLAAALNNLGAVLKAGGKREAAREAFNEALSILEPLSHRHPKAFRANFRTVLGHYIEVAEDSGDDPWWQRAREEATQMGPS